MLCKSAKRSNSTISLNNIKYRRYRFVIRKVHLNFLFHSDSNLGRVFTLGELINVFLKASLHLPWCCGSTMHLKSLFEVFGLYSDFYQFWQYLFKVHAKVIDTKTGFCVQADVGITVLLFKPFAEN